MAITVPIIDLANFPKELQKLANASTNVGCFRVINHGIPTLLSAEMKATAQSLFQLSADIKTRNVVQTIERGGYVPPNKLSRLFEAFGIFNAASPADIHSFCSLLGTSPIQSHVITEYVAKIHGLASFIARMVAESLGLVGCFFEEWKCHMRINSCNGEAEKDVGEISVSPHTDFAFLTVLQEDDWVEGLEIMDADGNFGAIDPVRGTFLVLIGDIGKVWSNGRLHNVMHRVVCKQAVRRISIAFFLLTPKEDKVKPQIEFTNSKHKNLYKEFNYFEYRKYRDASKLIDGDILSLVKAD